MTNKKEIDERELADPNNRNGYAPFPACIVISSERSGLNLIRHVVERLSGHRTPGKPHILSAGELIFHRTHYAYYKNNSPGRTSIHEIDGTDKYKKMILLLRDPREQFVRAYEKNWIRFHAYYENINAYSDFGGEKTIVYYDDLIKKDATFEVIFKLLDIVEDFDINRIKDLRKESVEWYDTYQSIGGGSMTKGNTELLEFHQELLTTDEITELSRLLKDKLGENITYLERWNANGWLR